MAEAGVAAATAAAGAAAALDADLVGVRALGVRAVEGVAAVEASARPAEVVAAGDDGLLMSWYDTVFDSSSSV